MKARKTILVSNVATSAPQYIVGASAAADANMWSWGGDNLTPQRYALLLRKSVAHRRIVNDKSDYVAGKGFTYDERNERLARVVERANAAESLQVLTKRTAFDYIAFGNAFVEVVVDKGVVMLFHHDATTVRLDKEGYAVIDSDWTEPKRATQQRVGLYPVFTQREDGTLRSIIHYKDYEPQFEHYGVPPYIAGLDVSAIVYKTDRWNISRLDNSFQLSGVMMLDSEMDSEEEADSLIRTAEEKFGGKPGQVLFVIRDGSEGDNSRFIPITSSNEGDWSTLHDQAVSDIVVAHSWFRSLSGLEYSSGFSSERILHEYEVALNTVILGEQDELLEPIKDAIESILKIDTSTLEIINRPPTRSKPIYMKVWEARKADGLEYDPEDPSQQHLLAQITKYNITSIDPV